MQKIAVGHAATRLLNNDQSWDILKWIAEDSRIEVVKQLVACPAIGDDNG